MAVVDGHVHVHRAGNPRSSNPVVRQDPDWAAPIEDLVADMDAADVDQAVIVSITSHRENHAYLAECMQRYPGRFAAIGGVDATRPDAAAVYARDADEFGLRGGRANGFEGLDEPDGRSVLAELATRGHCLWLFPYAEQYPRIRAVCRRYPDLEVVLNLLGLPWSKASDDLDEHGRPTRRDVPLPAAGDEPVLELSDLPNVSVHVGNHFQYSTEPHPHLDLAPMTRRILDAFGAERMLWMTNWPWIRDVPGYRASTQIVDAHLPDLTPVERGEIMGGTAARLLGLGPRG